MLGNDRDIEGRAAAPRWCPAPRAGSVTLNPDSTSGVRPAATTSAPTALLTRPATARSIQTCHGQPDRQQRRRPGDWGQGAAERVEFEREPGVLHPLRGSGLDAAGGLQPGAVADGHGARRWRCRGGQGDGDRHPHDARHERAAGWAAAPISPRARSCRTWRSRSTAPARCSSSWWTGTSSRTCC